MVSSCSYLSLLPPFANLPKGDLHSLLQFFLFFFFILVIFIFLFVETGGKGRERETLRWEPNISWLPPTHSPPRYWTHNPDMCPDREPNWWPFGARTAHRLGLLFILNHLPSGSHSTPWRHLFFPYSLLSKLTSWPSLNYHWPFHHSFCMFLFVLITKIMHMSFKGKVKHYEICKMGLDLLHKTGAQEMTLHLVFLNQIKPRKWKLSIITVAPTQVTSANYRCVVLQAFSSAHRTYPNL